jgi:hypothetical protein
MTAGLLGPDFEPWQFRKHPHTQTDDWRRFPILVITTSRRPARLLVAYKPMHSFQERNVRYSA